MPVSGGPIQFGEKCTCRVSGRATSDPDAIDRMCQQVEGTGGPVINMAADVSRFRIMSVNAGAFGYMVAPCPPASPNRIEICHARQFVCF